MADELYSLVVMSKSKPSQIQMNFADPDAANHAFAVVQGLTGRKVMKDGFGAKIVLDPDDIGHIFLQDIPQTLKFQAAVAVMQARAQAHAQGQAAADPVIRRGGLLVPANTIPQ